MQIIKNGKLTYMKYMPNCLSSPAVFSSSIRTIHSEDENKLTKYVFKKQSNAFCDGSGPANKTQSHNSFPSIPMNMKTDSSIINHVKAVTVVNKNYTLMNYSTNTSSASKF